MAKKTIEITGNRFRGRNGLRVNAGSDVHVKLENNSFDGVEIPFDLTGGSRVDMRGSRIKNDPKLQSTTGWRRPVGPPLPSFCPNCKAIFPSRNYVFAGAYFNAWDNEEVCPNCRFEHARLSEGLFDLTKATVEIISAPDITHAMVECLRDAANEILRGRSTPADAIARVEAKSLHLGDLLRKALNIGLSAVAFLSGVAGIASLYYSKKSFEAAQEQVQLAREANEIARGATPSADTILSRTLQDLKGMKFIVDGSTRRSVSKPSKSKSSSKSKPARERPKGRMQANELWRKNR
ncbi:hypothetical protein [Bradyrhizobium cajani]|uniref:Uncharacterized protein n=1 Tax=Bradyrhizobium cajani TaxID=1928661 RepID=A0A844TA28_9BRAD|nr:hypothetical protein [Bradyrhizobium cajani]MVT74445.1 hypothetical protein [Bradyrhizobium cajani]